MDGYIIGVDAGTSVVKTVVFDLSGNELGGARRIVPVINPEPHLAVSDMEGVWRAAHEVIEEVVHTAGVDRDRILGVALTGQGDGSWMIDTNGQPVGPGLSWTDGRAGGIIDGWYADGTVTRAFDITGCGPYAGSACALLRWRIENEPHLVGSGATNLWCKDWIEFKLTGDRSTDPSDASLLGIDVRKRAWSDEALNILGLRDGADWLPPLRAPSEACGEITREAAELCGLKPGTKVYKGMIDISASSLGVGVARPRDTMAVVGTAGIVTVATKEIDTAFVPQDVGWIIPHTDDTWIRALGMNWCTPNLDWYLREFGDPIKAELGMGFSDQSMWSLIEEKVAQIPIGSGGVMFHGYLSPGGERAPFVKPSARGSFNGITGGHTNLHLLRAIYEGIAYGIRDCLDAIPIEVETVRMAGGGAASPLWSEMFADVLGREVVIPAGREFGAKGAMIAACIGAGVYSSYEEAVDATVSIARRHEPVEANTALYDEFFGCYQAMRESTSAHWDRLQGAVRKVSAAAVA